MTETTTTAPERPGSDFRQKATLESRFNQQHNLGETVDWSSPTTSEPESAEQAPTEPEPTQEQPPQEG